MNNQEFAEFFIRTGNRVVETASGYWYEAYPFCFQSIPYHESIAPDPEEFNNIFFKKSALLVRYNSIDQTNTFPGNIWICENKDYDLALLGANTRSTIRRGLNRNSVERVSFEVLGNEGWKLIQDTGNRQRRNTDFANLKEWSNYCSAANLTNGLEAWVAFNGTKLGSLLVGAEINDFFYILHQASADHALKNYPNNALIYTVTKLKLSMAHIKAVSYGLDSIEDTQGLRVFKLRMGFSLREYNQKILINPLFQWIKRNRINALIQYILGIFPKNNYFRKAKAILNQITH